jgi:hypothetical protein
MNAEVLGTRVADGIAVITLGSARRIYMDNEMGVALTEALDGFAGDANVRVVVVTGGAPRYFIPRGRGLGRSQGSRCRLRPRHERPAPTGALAGAPALVAALAVRIFMNA